MQRTPTLVGLIQQLLSMFRDRSPAAMKKETGETQEATAKRDAALEKLDEWMSG